MGLETEVKLLKVVLCSYLLACWLSLLITTYTIKVLSFSQGLYQQWGSDMASMVLPYLIYFSGEQTKTYSTISNDGYIFCCSISNKIQAATMLFPVHILLLPITLVIPKPISLRSKTICSKGTLSLIHHLLGLLYPCVY